MNDITKRQIQCLKAIYDFSKVNGTYPTVREVGDKLGISSTQSVVDLLIPLKTKGYLSKKPNRPRGIELTNKARVTIESIDWPKVRQSSLFDMFIPGIVTVSGTISNYKYTYESSYINPSGFQNLLYDTDAISTLAEEQCLKFNEYKNNKFIVTTSTLNEYNKKFPYLPQNVTVVDNTFSYNNFCTIYNTSVNNIQMVWRSDNRSFSYRSRKPKIRISDVKPYEYGNNQLLLPIPGLLPSNATQLIQKLNLELCKISNFSDFAINGAAITDSGCVYVCSSHTARKNTDFNNFVKAVENKCSFVSGGDKKLIRDIRFNNLPFLIIKKINVNATSNVRKERL